ncbi:hypothetical protein ASD03_18660 [Ensifer sp. Root127]|nr:hypothetical protein ASD03_18660 [Ensifer sp. Root127]
MAIIHNDKTANLAFCHLLRRIQYAILRSAGFWRDDHKFAHRTSRGRAFGKHRHNNISIGKNANDGANTGDFHRKYSDTSCRHQPGGGLGTIIG